MTGHFPFQGVGDLDKQKVLVIGLGEVGISLLAILKESAAFDVYGFDTNKERMFNLNQGPLPQKVDVMHLCIPCTDLNLFVVTAKNYANQFAPALIIINSTLIPGTTVEVFKRCEVPTAHSPTRGVHESPQHMIWEMKRWVKYVGGADLDAGQKTKEHFEKAGLRSKTLKSSKESELAKLFETTYRAWMITCFQEMHRIARALGADFEDTVDFLDDTHRVRLDRPVMFPGVIGGHCQIPNTQLLLKIYDSDLLRDILKSNEKRKEEIKDDAVRKEVEKVKKKAQATEKELTEKIAKCEKKSSSQGKLGA